ncbi:DUF6263 family protein [Fulvivirga ligni]|uniref:DUF6263 family protein n=1 Tax=Fulvivirga ligni TaxID=2904246 RepID=UPI001F21B0F0|nr:DUF6263 family protein [Fulvivirga ligni]UII20372.1 DUF6263 family protein [Fulvivirga ligni]
MKIKHLLLVALMIPTLNAWAQKAKIELNLTKGETYSQSQKSTAKVSQQLGGQSMDIDMIITGSTDYTVTAIEGDVFSMDVKYTSLSMSMNSPQGKVEFSSENNGKDMMSQVFAGMKNKVFQIKMNKMGHVTSLSGLDNLWSVIDDFEGANDAQKEAVKAQLMQSYGEEAFKSSIELIFAVYPKEKVAPGSKWEVENKIRNSMTADLNGTYKYVEATNDSYIIHGESEVATDPSKTMTTNGMEISYDLQGNMIADIKIDKKSGWITEATQKQTMSGKAMTGGMEIPMSINTESEFSN